MDVEQNKPDDFEFGFELDPNSTFNKLKKLQRALKEEVSLKDICKH